MTYRPVHGHHGPVRRARARLAAWLWRRRYNEAEWDGYDDHGNHIGDVFDEDYARPGRLVPVDESEDGWPPPDDGRDAADAIRDAEAEETHDAPGCASPSCSVSPELPHPRQPGCPGGALGTPSLFPYGAEDVPGPVGGQEASEPGYLQPAVIKTVAVGGVYLPLTDDTLIDIRPEPRSGASAWTTALRRDRRPLPAWVQRWLDAPIGDVHAALRAPDPDAYLWSCSQRRALEMA